MEVKHKNLKEDFKLLISLGSTYGGEDFTLTFSSGRYGVKTYVCSYDGTTYTNCEMADDTHVLCKFDNHGLPCGLLVCDCKVCLPDTSMADGDFALDSKSLVEFLIDNVSYHLELTNGKSDIIETVEATFELLGTVLKGEKGDKMTYDSLTDEEKAELQKPATEAAVVANAAADSANSAADSATDAAESANNAAERANSAASSATDAAADAVTATNSANDAATSAKAAAESATSAATNANSTATEIKTDYDTNIKSEVSQLAQKVEGFDARVGSLSDLETAEKGSVVGAVNEARKYGGIVALDASADAWDGLVYSASKYQETTWDGESHVVTVKRNNASNATRFGFDVSALEVGKTYVVYLKLKVDGSVADTDTGIVMSLQNGIGDTWGYYGTYKLESEDYGVETLYKFSIVRSVDTAKTLALTTNHVTNGSSFVISEWDIYADVKEIDILGRIGDMTALTTDAKGDVVSAINEVDAKGDATDVNVSALTTQVDGIDAEVDDINDHLKETIYNLYATTQTFYNSSTSAGTYLNGFGVTKGHKYRIYLKSDSDISTADTVMVGLGSNTSKKIAPAKITEGFTWTVSATTTAASSRVYLDLREGSGAIEGVNLYVRIEDVTDYTSISHEELIDVLALKEEVEVKPDVLTDATFDNLVRQIPEGAGLPNLNFVFYSDCHGDKINFDRIMQFVEDKGIDIVINGGDSVNLNWASSIDYLTDNEYFGKVLMAIGNHDSRDESISALGSNGWFARTAAECRARYLVNAEAQELVIDDDVCYYYKDYTDSNIRVMVLDFMHWTDDEKTWIQSTLASAKEAGLHVLIVQHQPFTGDATTQTYCCLDNLGYTLNEETWNSKSYSVAPPVVAQYVQSFIDDGGVFICYICGHVHRDFTRTLKNYPKQFMRCVGNAGINAHVKSNAGSGYVRNDGDKSQDLFDLVTVDTDGCTITFNRIGNDRDRQGRYQGEICIDYGRGVLVERPVSSGGTSDYDELTNKPSIGGVELSGNKTLAQIGAAASSHTHSVSDISDMPSVPTKTSELTNDSNFVVDADYVHTDNNYDADAVAEVAKVSELSLKITDIESEIGDIDTALGNILGTTE